MKDAVMQYAAATYAYLDCRCAPAVIYRSWN